MLVALETNTRYAQARLQNSAIHPLIAYVATSIKDGIYMFTLPGQKCIKSSLANHNIQTKSHVHGWRFSKIFIEQERLVVCDQTSLLLPTYCVDEKQVGGETPVWFFSEIYLIWAKIATITLPRWLQPALSIKYSNVLYWFITDLSRALFMAFDAGQFVK